MTVVGWVAEGTWPACVDAVARSAASDERVVLVHVTPSELHGAAEAAYASMLGRGHDDDPRDPGARIDELTERNGRLLLEAAADRLGARTAAVDLVERPGAVERVVVEVAEAEDARLLVCVRDGDPERLGPPSLGPWSRFIVDHAPCDLLLVWPGEAPDVSSIPPPPPPGTAP